LFEHENAGGFHAEKNLMRSVVIANVLAGLCCLAMVGYGLIMLMISQLDPMDPYYAGIALGCALFGTFLVVPAISIVRSIKLARIDRRASISFALAPFAFIALAVVGIYATPSPAPPKAERIVRYPETPASYVWRLTRWRF
jgi:hypothetical protein